MSNRRLKRVQGTRYLKNLFETLAGILGKYGFGIILLASSFGMSAELSASPEDFSVEHTAVKKGLGAASWMGDHMVLADNRPLPVKGTASPGAKVTVTFADQRKGAIADAEGHWFVLLDPLAGRTQSMEFKIESSCTPEPLIFRDVVVGEVWLCSGQSNMQRTVHHSDKAEAESAKKAVQSVDLRYFDGRSWMRVSPDNIGRLSAVGAWFAIEMARNLDHPIGLYVAASGGTGIEGWLPKTAFPDTEHGRKMKRLADDPEVLQAAIDDALDFKPYGQHRLGKWGLSRTAPALEFEQKLRRFAQMPFNGVVWYQGESNAQSIESAKEYRFWLESMVTSWRKFFENPEMPIVVIELPEFESESFAGWTELQRQQAAVADALENVWLVGTKGLGDLEDIHPSRKKEVGIRAAGAALSKAPVPSAKERAALGSDNLFEEFESPVAFQPFEAGDRVAFLGDSITASGDYVHMIRLFYATRFPDRPVSFYNCGIGGARAETSWPRLDSDCLDLDPSIVPIMLGMNDSGVPKERLIEYQNFMTRIMDRISAEPHRRLVLMVPTPYDETARLETKNWVGRNDTIRSFGDWLAGQGMQRQAPVVDFNTPMLRINAERQKIDPTFSIIGKDRIHPDRRGHTVMTYYFLKAQGIEGPVASVEINGKTGSAKAVNAGVDRVQRSQDRLSFVYHPNSLPYPKEAVPFASVEDEWVPFTEELNREWLIVRELKKGRWSLSMDGKPVGEFSDAELASGIDMARQSRNPGYHRAHAVFSLTRQIEAAERNLRAIARVRWLILEPQNIDLDDTEQADAAVRAYVERIPEHAFWQDRAKVFFQLRSPEKRKAERERMEELMEELYENNSTMPIQVELSFLPEQ